MTEFGRRSNTLNCTSYFVYVVMMTWCEAAKCSQWNLHSHHFVAELDGTFLTSSPVETRSKRLLVLNLIHPRRADGWSQRADAGGVGDPLLVHGWEAGPASQPDFISVEPPLLTDMKTPTPQVRSPACSLTAFHAFASRLRRQPAGFSRSSARSQPVSASLVPFRSGVSRKWYLRGERTFCSATHGFKLWFDFLNRTRSCWSPFEDEQH